MLPPPELLLPFLIASLAINFTPGADMTFVAVSGARAGRSGALSATAGIFTGCLGHIAFAVVGLSALIAASQYAFTVVKWLGVGYLVFLAIRLVCEGGERHGPADAGSADQRLLPIFRQATLVNLLNPKVGIFFIAFLPQFVTPGAEAPWLQILGLGLLFNTTGAIVNGAVGVISATTAGRFAQDPRRASVARWFAATVMGGLAVKLALSRTG
jgi:threonine/homoserine/homoserine lactone efflux protein